MKANLILEDGKSFTGEAIGANRESVGELILNTAVVGYQEMMTDPANAGKILVLTYPLIGNYGIAAKFNESKQVWLAGLVIKEKSRIYSNWQAKAGIDDFIKNNNLVAITEVDTRSLAVHLRHKGQMLGIISTVNKDKKEPLSKIAEFRKKASERESLLPKISVKKLTHLGKQKAKLRIGIIDLGITNGIIRQLESLGLSISVLPYNTLPQEILRLKLHGLIISGGPEEDAALENVTTSIKQLIDKLPLLGISTGHQVLAQALGAKLIKMKLGHHGVNYPIQNPFSYKGEISVQNHSYVVDADSLLGIKGIKITGYNLNDRTVEEIESKKFNILGIQYYPASPGFNEVNVVFKRFVNMIKHKSK